MEKEINKIKDGIEKAIKALLEELDCNEVDVDMVNFIIEYNDGFHYIKLEG